MQQGAVCASPEEFDQGTVEADLAQADAQLKSLYTFKVLLLGPGESGKSTVLKQLKAIHNVKPTPGEIEGCKKALHQNTLECMRALVKQAGEFKLEIEDEDDRKTASWLLDGDVYEDTMITPAEAKAIQKLWESKAIRETYAQRDKFWILESIEYYVENVSRFAEEEFKPDEKDFVMCRIRTTGAIENKLKVPYAGRQPDEPEHIFFNIVDVGGQRNERKKWFNMFSDVKAIIFLVNLAGYNSVLFESNTRNRMVEALEVFGTITGHQNEAKRVKNPNSKKKKGAALFKNVPIYLVLNKKDLFEVQIRKVGLDKTFPDYKDGTKTDKAVEFIRQKFRDRCPQDKKIEEIFDITGLSRAEVKRAFNDIRRALLAKNRAKIKADRKKILETRASLEKKKAGGGKDGGCSIM